MAEQKEWKKMQVIQSRVFLSPRISDFIFAGINPNKGLYDYKVEIPEQSKMKMLIHFRKRKRF